MGDSIHSMTERSCPSGAFASVALRTAAMTACVSSMSTVTRSKRPVLAVSCAPSSAPWYVWVGMMTVPPGATRSSAEAIAASPDP